MTERDGSEPDQDRIGADGDVVLGQGGTGKQRRGQARAEEGFKHHKCAFSERSVAVREEWLGRIFE